MLVIENDQVKEQGVEEKRNAVPPRVSGGKSMLATFVGGVFVLIGLWGMIHWSQQLIFVLKGFVPLCLCLGGIVAAVIGLASLKPNMELKKLADENDSPKSS